MHTMSNINRWDWFPYTTLCLYLHKIESVYHRLIYAIYICISIKLFINFYRSQHEVNIGHRAFRSRDLCLHKFKSTDYKLLPRIYYSISITGYWEEFNLPLVGSSRPPQWRITYILLYKSNSPLQRLIKTKLTRC